MAIRTPAWFVILAHIVRHLFLLSFAVRHVRLLLFGTAKSA